MGVEIKIRYMTENREDYIFEVFISYENTDKLQVQLTSPDDFMLSKYNISLSEGLCWYFETYSTLPISANKPRALDIMDALKNWADKCYAAILGGKKIGKNAESANIKIISENPQVLSWPWEAIFCGHERFKPQQCRFERSLKDASRYQFINASSSLSHTSQLNILYIISRDGKQDIGYSALAEPLMHHIKTGHWLVLIDVLRPATIDALEKKLSANPDFYHIVHFDGHGKKGGFLCFDEGPDVDRHTFARIISMHRVPYVVLNACQSAMTEEIEGNVFSSVAEALLKSNVVGVLAMGYKLSIDGAKEFVPAFYKALFKEGDICKAVSSAQQVMIANNNRCSVHGDYKLNDWLIPVFYGTSLLPLPKLKPRRSDNTLNNRLIGRDKYVLDLEYAIRKPYAGTIIHGLAGVGKSALARGFIEWLEFTGAHFTQYLFLDFAIIPSASHVLSFMAKELDVSVSSLNFTLKKNPVFIVWDNFESCASYEDKADLEALLIFLRHGQSKILITSRTPEDWLDERACGDNLIHLKDDADPTIKTDSNDQSIVDIENNEVATRLHQSLALLNAHLSDEYETLLRLSGLHIRYLTVDSMNDMLKMLDKPTDKTTEYINTLIQFGLCTNDTLKAKYKAKRIYIIHSALSAWLQKHYPASNEERRVFADVMSTLAETLVEDEMNNRNTIMPLFDANMRNALEISNQLGLDLFAERLYGSIACMSFILGRYDEARLFLINSIQRLYEMGNNQSAASHHHMLGAIAKNQGYLDDAILCYDKSLELSAQYNKGMHFSTMFEKGTIHQMRDELEIAYPLYLKVLYGLKDYCVPGLDAMTYHHMGLIKSIQKDYETAFAHFSQTLDRYASIDDDIFQYNTADTLIEIGKIQSDYKQNFAEADHCYNKALHIYNKFDDKKGMIKAYQVKVALHLEYEKYAEAENFTIEILKLNGTASVDVTLGMSMIQLAFAAFSNEDFVSAERWCLEAKHVFANCNEVMPHLIKAVNDSMITANKLLDFIDRHIQ